MCGDTFNMGIATGFQPYEKNHSLSLISIWIQRIYPVYRVYPVIKFVIIVISICALS